MKFLKIISLILAFAIFSCTLMSCDQNIDDPDVEIPERDFYELKVSFQVKSADGQTVINAKDYLYKGHAEPTILNILERYFSVDESWTFKVDKENNVTQIGNMKIAKNSGDYFGFVTNVTGTLPDDLENLSMEKIAEHISIKEMSAIDLSLDQINKYKNEDGSMSNTYLVDGAQFTVILFVYEE